MQQSEHAAPQTTGGGTATKVPGGLRPVLRYGLLFGSLSGLFALLQLAVSVTSAIENRSAYASVAYGLQNNGFNLQIIGQWLGPVLVATYTSCLVAFGLSMWLAWYAGRVTAVATRRRSLGALVGMLTSVVGSAIWIVVSVGVAAVARIDGTLSGILTASVGPSTGPNSSQIFWLVGQEVAAALFAIGFAAIAGRLGAASVRLPEGLVSGPAQTSPVRYIAFGPYGPYAGGVVPPAVPALTPPPARPFVVAPMYPPPPELYRQQQAAPYGYPTAPGYPNASGYLPATAYPAYPAYPGYPPMAWAPPPTSTATLTPSSSTAPQGDATAAADASGASDPPAVDGTAASS